MSMAEASSKEINRSIGELLPPKHTSPHGTRLNSRTAAATSQTFTACP